MLKDIAVMLPVDRPAGALIDYAASLAKRFEAHLDGIACVYQSMNPMIASEAAAVVMGADYDSGADQAAAVLDQFELATRALEVEHDARSTFDVSFAATRTLTGMSRLYDLNVVAQPDRAHPSATDFLAETILFGSGRPLLLVPYIARGAFSCDRILICWDGGLPAARAVHDALPFLKQAQTIDIVSVNEPENGDGNVAAAALQAHLARRDLAVRPFRLTASSANIHNAILSLAADNATDLIVMGGYGHSKLREFILGGTTRGIFESLTVPALMSH
jgi:nucleotide-binding universal stress UspA family protein